MLIIQPKMNEPIHIKDTVSSIEWDFVLRYTSQGKVSITFDAPKTIVINNTTKTVRTEDTYESQTKL